MQKRYVVILDSGSTEQNESFTSFLKSKGFGWWHWLSHTWLLTDQNGIFSAELMRNEITNIYPGVHVVVLQIEGGSDNWSGFGPKSADKDMFKWLHNNWHD